MTTVMLPERETPTVVEDPIEAVILERAALVIEEFGHCVGALYEADNVSQEDQDGRAFQINDPRIKGYCEIGAIWRAGFDHGLLPGGWGDFHPRNDLYTSICGVAGIRGEENIHEIHTHSDRHASASASAANLRALAQEARER